MLPHDRRQFTFCAAIELYPVFLTKEIHICFLLIAIRLSPAGLQPALAQCLVTPHFHPPASRHLWKLIQVGTIRPPPVFP